MAARVDPYALRFSPAGRSISPTGRLRSPIGSCSDLPNQEPGSASNATWTQGIDRLLLSLAPLPEPLPLMPLVSVPAPLPFGKAPAVGRVVARAPLSPAPRGPGSPMYRAIGSPVPTSMTTPGSPVPVPIANGATKPVLSPSSEDSLEALSKRLRVVEGRVRHWHNILFHLHATLQPSGATFKVSSASPPIMQSDMGTGGACLEAALRSLEHLSVAWEVQDLSSLRTRVFSSLFPTSSRATGDYIQCTPSDVMNSVEPKQRQRDARWPTQLKERENEVDAACNVLQLMLERDQLDAGSRADIQFAQNVLIKIVKRSGAKGALHEQKLNDPGVDEHAMAYLTTFGQAQKRRKPKTFRQVVQAIMVAQHLMRVCRSTRRRGSAMGRRNSIGSVSSVDLELASSCPHLLAVMDTYDEFDIFEFDSFTRDQKLPLMGVLLMKQHRLIPFFRITTSKLNTFFDRIEDQYMSDNPYHNSLHATDVMQTVHAIICSLPRSTLSEMEVLTLLFAACCHDVGHPGVTNQFRVAEQDDGAITYNDISVNENMHCALTYRTLQNKECNFLDGLSEAQAIAVRKLMIEIVLATDMARHFANLAKFKSIVEEKGGDPAKWESRVPFIEILVHLADISATTKSLRIALKWSERVMDEFFVQGDRERMAGRDISPLCDRRTVCLPSSQVGFVDFIVMPIFTAFGSCCDVGVCLKNLKAYRQHFSELKEKKEKAAKAKELKDAAAKPKARETGKKPLK